MEPKALALETARILKEKQATDIQILEVSHLTSIADYFVIATGRSSLAVRALCEDLDEKLAEQGLAPRRQEGLRESRWVVSDYASVIVHLFHPEERAYYNIERLWTDGSNQIPLPDED